MIAHIRFTSTGDERCKPQNRVDRLPVQRGVSNFIDMALVGDCLVPGFEMTMTLGDYRRTWTLLEVTDD